MNELNTQAEAAMKKLLNAEDDQLYEQLGIRAKGMAVDPGLAGSFDPAVTYDAAQMGLKDDVRELGQRLFKRWNKEAYGLVCGGDGDDQKEREGLLKAFGVDETTVAAALAALLVSSFGAAPAIAAVIAALVIRRFFRPAYEEFCVVWGKNVGAATA